MIPIGANNLKPMSKTIVYGVDVQFGDCDPAGIVFFPNYSRWMDAASHHFFTACGLPPWRAMTQLPGCVGAPLLIQTHRVTRGDTLVCEGRETRALCLKEDSGKLKAVPVPEFVRSACA